MLCGTAVVLDGTKARKEEGRGYASDVTYALRSWGGMLRMINAVCRPSDSTRDVIANVDDVSEVNKMIITRSGIEDAMPHDKRLQPSFMMIPIPFYTDA